MKGRRVRRGQALVEFALVLPILVLLILGIFDFGRAYNAYEVVTDAAREAARRAVVDDTVSMATVQNIAVAALQRASLTANTSMVVVTSNGTPGLPNPHTAGAPVSVQVNLPFTFLFIGPFMGWATGQNTITLSSTCVMRQE